MKHTKIILALLLIFMLALWVNADETATSGACGENAYWSYDATTKTLTISGTGAIITPNGDQPCWGPLYGKIVRVVFDAGITHIAENAFIDHVSISDITFLGDMPTFGDNCFKSLYCSVFYPKDNSTWSGNLPANTGANEIYFQPFGNESTHCGLTATWSYDEATRTLTIDGSGAMFEYFDETRQPWYDFREEVEYVIVGEKITHIGRNVFSNMVNLKSLRCKGDMPTFSFDHAVNVKIQGYFPDGNSTWDFSRPMIGSQNGSITWNIFYDVRGNCGGNTTWEVDLETGTLTIAGSGKMKAYEQWENPWRHYNDVITKVIVKGTVDHIGDFAFFRLFHVTQIIIEEGVTSIGRNALQNTLISGIKLPDSVKKMGMVVLGSSHNLTELTLPKNLETLGENSFVDCPNLKAIYFGPNLTTLEESALAMLQGTSVYFTGDAPSFAEDTFRLSNATVYFPKNNPTWTPDLLQQYGGNSIVWIGYDPENPDDIDPPIVNNGDAQGTGWQYTSANHTLAILPDCDQLAEYASIQAYGQLATNVVFVEGVTYVEDYILTGLTNLEYVTLAESIVTIGKGAFSGCTGLQKIVLPSELAFIGAEAFADCSGLSGIYFNTTIAPSIADTAFYGVIAEILIAADPSWDIYIGQDFGGDLSWVGFEQDPTEPTPTEPAPTEPAPTEPEPTELTPTEPTPTEPQDVIILDTSLVTKDTLETAKQENKNIVLPAGQCQWIIDPSSIQENLPESIDLSVQLNTTSIPQGVIDTIDPGQHSLQLSLAHDGQFGFDATLTVPVGTNYQGMPVILYYWTPEGSLEQVATGTVNSSGLVDLQFTHASEYLLVIGASKESPNGYLWIGIGILAIAGVATVACFMVKKRKANA